MSEIKMTAQQVYDYLRKIYGGLTAYDIMESLEGNPGAYENLKVMIASGELEPEESEEAEEHLASPVPAQTSVNNVRAVS